MAPLAKCAPLHSFIHSIFTLAHSFLQICVAANKPDTPSRPSSPSTCRPQPSSASSACLGSQPRTRLPAVHGLLHAARRLRHCSLPTSLNALLALLPNPFASPAFSSSSSYSSGRPLIPGAQTMRAHPAPRVLPARSWRRTRRVSAGSSARWSV
ncbi:hypothetical protein C8J57DRAFT_1357927 [Mycena rebaudengoi]|nr:hypothetical protein C8J57DRAFT_1357927 [Mycena rebaudengoi]